MADFVGALQNSGMAQESLTNQVSSHHKAGSHVAEIEWATARNINQTRQ